MTDLQGYVEGMIQLSGGGSGGSTVEITPVLSSGTKIADYEIDGDEGSLYAPTPINYVAGEGITIENNVISLSGGTPDQSVVCILKVRCLALNGYTVTLTDPDGGTTTVSVSSNDLTVMFEIVNAGIYTLSNSKNSDTKSYDINITNDVLVGAVTSIIPILSDNTGSNGVAIAPSSSPNYGNGNAFKAFDNDFTTWLEYNGENQRGAYIGYIFTNQVYIDNLVAYMGNYDSGNNYAVKLQLTNNGTDWTDFTQFNVSGYGSGSYGTFTQNIKQIVKGFRYYSTQEKTGGNNWYTYDIVCNGCEL